MPNVRDKKEISQASSTPRRATWVFKVLALTALLVLWVIPGYHGMGKKIRQVIETRKLDDGEKLITHYIGLWPIDRAIAALVVFFYPVTFGENIPTHILLIDLIPTLFSVSLYMTIESYRTGNKKAGWLKAKPWIWGILYQLIGGAVVFPLWCAYNLSQKPMSNLDHYAMSKGHAQVLPFSFALSSLLPAFFVLRHLHPELHNSTITQQWLIAIMQFAPVFLAVFQHILGSFWEIYSGNTSTADLKYVKRAVLFSGIVCTVSHLLSYYLALQLEQLNAVFNPWTSLGRLQTLGELAGFLLRWDHALIEVTLVVWSYMGNFPGTFDPMVVAGLIPAHAVLGAGGVMALAFLRREDLVRVGRMY